MHSTNAPEAKIVGFESQPIPQSTSNMKTLAITGGCLVVAVFLFCSLTGTRFTHKPIGTVGGNPDGTKYVAPWKKQRAQTPEEARQFVKDFMKDNAAFIHGK